MKNLTATAELLRQQGKNGDTVLAHITPKQADFLKSQGGSGTINPITGLPQYFLGLGAVPLGLIGNYLGKNQARQTMRAAMPIATNPLRNFIQNNTPPPPPSPEEQAKISRQDLLEKLQQQMYQDQVNLEKMGYAAYPGETRAPMSASTQNARQMQADARGKPAPYTGKINQVLSRANQGFNPEQMNNLMDMIDRREVSQDLATQRMQKQFGNTFGYSPERSDRLEYQIGKDTARGVNSAYSNLQQFNQKLGNLEDRRDLGIVDSLRRAGSLKEGRRDALINQLDQFGNQEHALRNLQNQGDQDAFNEERMAPYRKLNKAQAALNGIDMDEMHPTRSAVENDRLQQIVNAYNMPYTPYVGERVVGMQPETTAAFETANQINPKYRDMFYQDRKGIEGGLLNESLGDKVYNAIPETFNPLMNKLDEITKRQIKDSTKQVGGHYARQGTYGSAAHQARNQEVIRDLLRKVQDERETGLLGAAKTQTGLIGKKDQNDMMRYNAMNEMGAKEFSDILKANDQLSKLGWNKRANKQAEENRALSNWQGEMNYEWPTLAARFQENAQGAGRDLGNQSIMAPYMELAKQYNTDLTSLFNQPQIYDETKKAVNQYQQNADKRITDMESYYAQQNNNLTQAETDYANQQKALQDRLAAERQAALNRQVPQQVAAPMAASGNLDQFMNMFKDKLWNKYSGYRKLTDDYSRDAYRDPRRLSYIGALPQLPQGSNITRPGNKEEFFNMPPWYYSQIHLKSDDFSPEERSQVWKLGNAGRVNRIDGGYNLA